MEDRKVAFYVLNLGAFKDTSELLDQRQLDILEIQASLTNSDNAWILIDNPFSLAGSNVDMRMARQVHDLVEVFTENCPGVSVFVSFDNPIVMPRADIISLLPLDEAAFSNYISLHEHGGRASISDIESGALFRYTKGYPERIDSVLGILEGSSVEQLLSYSTADQQRFANAAKISSLRRARIDYLKCSSDKYDQRVFLLLKALIVFPFGIKTSDVEHFIASEPIHPTLMNSARDEGLLQFEAELSYADKRRSQFIIPSAETSDYIRGLLTVEELNELYRHGMSVLLGQDWRIGKFKLAESVIPDESTRGVSGALNLNDILARFFAECIQSVIRGERDAPNELRYFIAALEFYTRKLFSADCHRLIFEFCTTIDKRLRSSLDDPKLASVLYRYADSCRLLKYYHEAIELASELLKSEAARDLTLSTNMVLARCYDSVDDSDRRDQHLGIVLTAKKKTALRMAADAFLLVSRDGEAAFDRLKRLASQAQKAGHSNVYHNISMRLADMTDEQAAKSNILKQVIDSSRKHSDVYNWARASVLYYSKGVDYAALNDRDVESLWAVCLYYRGEKSYHQFEKSYAVLWLALSAKNNVDKLIDIYLMSSVYFRLAGKPELEAKYLAELVKIISRTRFVVDDARLRRLFARRQSLVGLGKTVEMGNLAPEVSVLGGTQDVV